jgi:predicted metal-binding transcription factor (methanogenesis marker protein 9)
MPDEYFQRDGDGRRKTMSENQRTTAAREYVDQQLATMRDSGMLASEISEDEYRGLVEEISNALTGHVRVTGKNVADFIVTALSLSSNCFRSSDRP